ncbi:MAG TPA: glycosyltransferase N-terminal domain-containing protein [Candidatus Dormibacteraeota bacterium]|nr:glycosyltransferase N-terminal domain-containing protein [Candidatus Dormibacteraeota bacterium]
MAAQIVNASMLHAAYNLLWYPALPFALLASHPGSLRDYRERMGRGEFPSGAGAPRIWIHASSVGEIEAVRPVANGLLEHYRGAVLAITTMTATGRDAARRRIPDASAWMLAPFDSPRAVRSFLARFRPDVLLITETEIWPNYFLEAARFGARIAVVNGRMSERSMRRYMLARSLFEDALGRANLIMTQSRDDACRYGKLNGMAEHAKIIVTGNTKISADAENEMPIRPELLAFAPERQILIAGSTAAGEELVLVDAYRELRQRFRNLAMVIAPRHLDRAGEVEKILQADTLRYVKASNLDRESSIAAADILILDTMGDLRALYRRATVAFVGGSLAPGRGGQSPAEPAMAGVPVLIGPYHENQRDSVTSILAAGGAAIVKNATDVVNECARWLVDDAPRRNAGSAARDAILGQSGGARIAVEKIQALIDLG